jgi:N-hydroxyarylamine O-acetyltransferase
MYSEATDIKLFRRYLSLLGIVASPPSLENLAALVQAQLTRIPFENISKLYYRNRDALRTLPGLELYIDGIEKYHFGGTCYANNYYLHRLLKHLGYQVILCGADMTNPDVHLVNVVTISGREYIVDAGYGAPFLEPMPRDLATDYEIRLGHDRYVLRPQDERHYSRLDLFRDGALKHGYTVKPMPRTIDFFSEVIAHSFTDQATFMNALLITRFFPGRSLVVYNLTRIECIGAEVQIRQLVDRRELVSTIEQDFGIPSAISEFAISTLGDLADPWN